MNPFLSQCTVLLLLTPFMSISVSAKAEYQHMTLGNNIVDVVKIDDLKSLRLYLNNDQNQAYKKFDAMSKALKPCEKMTFAMNAGMYHADFSPVGLYVEKFKKIKNLNQQIGFGNFFMQPNGVVAWNESKAVIQTTQKYKENYQKHYFKAKYATQSGPMLVIDGEINSQFEPKSTSLKIRNGVGIKDNQLYFVISKNRISFYDFAQIFKNKLGIQNALYLDGSISSAYIPQVHRNDQTFNLGPIVAYIEPKGRCDTP